MSSDTPPSRTIVLTFDNLGEASALQRGTADPHAELGSDPSVTTALPRLLDELDRHALRATFFIEAINCELNPQAVIEIDARGHELGVHGWSHEPWADLHPTNERELLERSTKAFRKLGLPVRAFRPPGGGLTEQTESLLRSHGYAWCSPEGEEPAVHDGLVIVPFTWPLVDAYRLMERFEPLRRQRNDRAQVTSPDELGDQLADTLANGTRPAQTLVLHPFLMLDEQWFDAVRRLLERLAQLRGESAASVVPGRDLAARLTAERRSDR
jgi:peptidoglycan/xylan/chitin deacetylase (PgdA/CDA1 family)